MPKKILLPIKNSSNFYEVNPSKIICLGLNYADHVKEHDINHITNQYKTPPSEPILFPKSPNVLVGSGENVIYPSILERIGLPRLDYEGELAFIIGTKCKDVKKEDYAKYILGYTCFNDITARDVQKKDISEKQPWYRSKSMDTFGPIGPVLVLQKDIGDPQNLKLETRLNGKIVQSSNTNYMVFKINYLVEYISSFFTLEPGDIIVTGTPSGIGQLKRGDTIEVEIEHIGILQNTII